MATSELLVPAPPPPVPRATDAQVAAAARRMRRRILRCAARGPSHIGPALSLADILATLYARHLRVDPARPRWAGRDRLVLSKGHGVLALYAALEEAGFLDAALMDGYGDPGSPLAGHPVEYVPGVDAPTGALGHGLSLGAGMALAARMDGRPWSVVVVMGDGELDEGSVWEAAMFAAHQRLDGLVAVVDRNGYQQEGPTARILDLEPLADKWRAFGWHAVEVPGHDPATLSRAFDAALARPGRPTVLIARTVKGRGVSFMENEPAWHMGRLDPPTLARALAEVADPAEES
jgi:transketolase